MSTRTRLKERRAHPRRDTRLGIQATPESGGVVARMVTHNLSASGLFCTSSTDFTEMTRLAVRLLLPVERGRKDETQPLDVEAVVVRREKLEDGPSGEERYELGLFFTRLDDAARLQLERYLDS